MKPYLSFLFTALLLAVDGQSFAQALFPKPDTVLYDTKHKEPKSGVEVVGNEIRIRSGVGTPSTINVLAFSRDSSLLAAGKDFGRVVLWDTAKGSVIRAVETGQGIVNAVAISPDNQLIATAGQGDSKILIWSITDGSLLRSVQVENAPVRSLEFGLNNSSLVGSGNGGPTFVIDAASGKPTKVFPNEWSPILSVNGKAMMTVRHDSLVVRNTQTWKEESEIQLPTKSAWPLSLDTDSDMYIYGDPEDDHSFISVRLGTGELFPDQKFGRLPQWNPSEGGFAAIDSRSHLVFGHSGGRLWLWNIKDGKSCTSPILYSESGALSPNGSLLAGGLDNSIIASSKVKPGVAIWHTASISTACGIGEKAQ